MNEKRKEFPHVEIVQAIKNSRDTFMLRTELFAVMAADLKAKYDSLVGAGFTAEQALELCKSQAI